MNVLLLLYVNAAAYKGSLPGFSDEDVVVLHHADTLWDIPNDTLHTVRKLMEERPFVKRNPKYVW